MSEGVHYWEIAIKNTSEKCNIMVGASAISNPDEFISHNPLGWAFYEGNAYHNQSGRKYGDISGFTPGDIVGVYVDFNKREISFFYNSRNLGVAYRDISGSIRPGVTLFSKHDSINVHFPTPPKVKSSIQKSVSVTRPAFDFNWGILAPDTRASNAGLTIRQAIRNKPRTSYGSVEFWSGKHYWEIFIRHTETNTRSNIMIGVSDIPASLKGLSFLSHHARGWSVYANNG